MPGNTDGWLDADASIDESRVFQMALMRMEG